MNCSFLVDVNLPKHFNFFNDNRYVFVSDINLQMTDSEIWDYALKNEMVILTKDTDFYNNWVKIQSEIENSRLIIAKENHVECIR